MIQMIYPLFLEKATSYSLRTFTGKGFGRGFLFTSVKTTDSDSEIVCDICILVFFALGNLYME